MHYKSGEQQQLLKHSRHPIFLGPLVILWAVPVMTYDRLLVALMLPLYVGCGSIINDEDVSYVKDQFTMKRRQLATGPMEWDNYTLCSIQKQIDFHRAQG